MSNKEREHLVVSRGEPMRLTVFISAALTLGVTVRAKELRRRVKSKIDRWAPASRTTSPECISAEWSRRNFADFQSALADLEAIIEDFQKDRLEPKVVQEALGITAQEYRRWVKDGRLPKSGTGQFRKGKQIFQYFTHAHSDIASLVQHPELIQSWRDADQRNGR